MKKVTAIICLIFSIGLDKINAQEKTVPIDSALVRDNMRIKIDDMPTPVMDIEPIKKDNTRIDNMPIKRDTTPMQMDNMQREKMPPKANTEDNRKRDDGKYFWETRQDTALKGMYNGQRIRSDTIRNRNGAYYNGMRLEDMPNYKKTPQNRKELDGTQNGKYNYETSRDSMPDAKNIDPYRKKYGSKYGDKMERNSAPEGEQKMRAQMAKENRGVMMHRGRTMIVRNGQKTFIKNYTYLSYGTKVMKDGTIVKQDGTKTMMKQGEFVNMMGEIVPMKDEL